MKLLGRERTPTPAASYQDALKAAKDQYKFLLVYLHSSFHDDAPAFCSCAFPQERDEYFAKLIKEFSWWIEGLTM